MTDLDDPQDPPPVSALHRRWNRRLRSVAGVRSELVRVYGEAREGLVDPQDATRLAHLLVSLVRLTETHEFERRLEELEALFDADDRARARTNGRDRHAPSPRH